MLEDATSTWTAVRRLVPQPAVQLFGSKRRGGHPLAEDWVERANGVAHGHDPVGEAPEAVVVPQAILGRALAGDGCQRLGPRDRLVERRAPQISGEGELHGVAGEPDVPAVGVHPGDIAGKVQRLRAGPHQLPGQAREEPLQGPAAAFQHNMHMPALRQPLAGGRGL
jgi:hypothetical protein